jgi:hypothetical protein
MYQSDERSPLVVTLSQSKLSLAHFNISFILGCTVGSPPVKLRRIGLSNSANLYIAAVIVSILVCGLKLSCISAGQYPQSKLQRLPIFHST